jgi:hypothetical protein
MSDYQLTEIPVTNGLAKSSCEGCIFKPQIESEGMLDLITACGQRTTCSPAHWIVLQHKLTGDIIDPEELVNHERLQANKNTNKVQ